MKVVYPSAESPAGSRKRMMRSRPSARGPEAREATALIIALLSLGPILRVVKKNLHSVQSQPEFDICAPIPHTAVPQRVLKFDPGVGTVQDDQDRANSTSCEDQFDIFETVPRQNCNSISRLNSIREEGVGEDMAGLL